MPNTSEVRAHINDNYTGLTRDEREDLVAFAESLEGDDWREQLDAENARRAARSDYDV